jgi:hypothetical protein
MLGDRLPDQSPLCQKKPEKKKMKVQAISSEEWMKMKLDNIGVSIVS